MKITKKAAAAATTPAPATGGIKKLDLGKIGGVATAKASKYPLVKHAEAPELAKQIIDLDEKFDAIDGALKSAKDELKQIVVPEYFDHCSGKIEIPSSMQANDPDLRPVLITLKNAYAAADEDAVVAVLGADTGLHFRQSFEIKIKGDAIPEASAEGFVAELAKLAAKCGASNAIEVKAKIKPTEEFHTKRHTLFDAETNRKLHAVAPCQVSIKTKGVK